MKNTTTNQSIVSMKEFEIIAAVRAYLMEKDAVMANGSAMEKEEMSATIESMEAVKKSIERMKDADTDAVISVDLSEIAASEQNDDEAWAFRSSIGDDAQRAVDAHRYVCAVEDAIVAEEDIPDELLSAYVDFDIARNSFVKLTRRYGMPTA